MPIPELVKWCRLDEGTHLEPYPDSRGLWTIGTGHLIKDPVCTAMIQATPNIRISQAAADELLLQDLSTARSDAISVFGAAAITPPACARTDALINLCFDLGWVQASRFLRLRHAVARRDWMSAALNVLYKDPTTRPPIPTDYARQTGVNANRIARALAFGRYPWDSVDDTEYPLS